VRILEAAALALLRRPDVDAVQIGVPVVTAGQVELGTLSVSREAWDVSTSLLQACAQSASSAKFDGVRVAIVSLDGLAVTAQAVGQMAHQLAWCEVVLTVDMQTVPWRLSCEYDEDSFSDRLIDTYLLRYGRLLGQLTADEPTALLSVGTAVHLGA